MKKIVLCLFGVLAILLIAGCKQPTGGSGGIALGNIEVVQVGSELLNIIYANDQASVTFPTGTDDVGTATLTAEFWMGETEVTNAVMAEVYQWAYDNGKFRDTESDPNGLDATTAKHGGQQLLDLDVLDCRVDYDGSGTFSAQAGYENNPVTNVTWYGAVMFCNWLTEMRDGGTGNVVYTGMDTDWMHDETVEDATKNGYRLPSGDEWEYAARYRGTDAVNTVSGYSNPFYTKGNSASDAITYYNDENDVNPANGVVDGKDANDAVAVYGSYWDGSGWVSKGTSDEAAVKSLGAVSANVLGVYDMSGNVSEWCFTVNGTNRITRGGGWSVRAVYLRVGYVHGYPPYDEGSSLGFRLCRTAD